MSTYGIDVSQYQGNIDYTRVKAAGKSFVIIRAGYGRYASQKDPYFEKNYANATAAGLHVGAYWYSYATSVAEIEQEMAVFLHVIAGKKFDMPIYIDFEERNQFALGRTACSNMIRAAFKVLESAGYWAGLYIFRSALENYVDDDIKAKKAIAVAEYASACHYSGQYGMWQYSNTGRVNGISGDVDLDVCYVDYPKLIKENGKNGYTKASTLKYQITKETPIVEFEGTAAVGKTYEVKGRQTICGVQYGRITDKGWISLKDAKQVDK